MRNLKKLALIGGASALMAITALTGCESSRHSDRTAGRTLDDKMITRDVQDRLETEPIYKFTDVDVKTFAGVVQLSGFVSTDEQKQRAGDIARQVTGVTQVVNNISLKPTTGTGLTATGRTNQLNEPRPIPAGQSGQIND
ncbi:MAG TPA: BON domain-containing protein [Verrucomicrobiae bacterium]|nr:BON domain-containing protein [Verrucomicrobiae bacterium]